MARKSEIRMAAKAGLDALLAAMQTTDDQQAEAHITTAFRKLTEAAGGNVGGYQDDRATRRPGQGHLGLTPGGERHFSDDQRIAMAKRGHAIPVRNEHGEIVGGRYPIEVRRDVEHAVHDADRTSASRKVRKHIVSQAQRLGAMDAIPDSWKGGKAKTRESAPLTLRESVAIGETSVLDAAMGSLAQDERLSLLDRLDLPRDEYSRS